MKTSEAMLDDELLMSFSNKSMQLKMMVNISGPPAVDLACVANKLN